MQSSKGNLNNDFWIELPDGDLNVKFEGPSMIAVSSGDQPDKVLVFKVEINQEPVSKQNRCKKMDDKEIIFTE